MEWSEATIENNGFSMVLGQPTIGNDGFSMVGHHWFNDGMVTYHRWSLPPPHPSFLGYFHCLISQNMYFFDSLFFCIPVGLLGAQLMPFPRVWSPSHAVLEPTVNLSHREYMILEIGWKIIIPIKFWCMGFVNPYVIIVTKVWYTRYILSHAPITYKGHVKLWNARLTSTQNTKIWGYDYLWRMLYTNTMVFYHFTTCMKFE